MKITSMLLGGVAAIAVVTVLFGSWYTIDQGERGVITCNGAICGEAEPGLHFKTPIVQGVISFSIKSQNIEWQKSAEGDSRFQAYSQDQQPATIALSVNYHINNATALYAKYGSNDTVDTVLIEPRSMAAFKNVFGQFNAVEAIRDRAKLSFEVTDAIRQAIGVGAPVTVDSVQIVDIEFSKAYEEAVERQMTAQVKQNEVEALKRQRITAADAGAYEVKAKADADAHRVQVSGQAEAVAIEAKGKALRENPGVPELIRANAALAAAQGWNGALPTTMVPGGAVPFIKITPEQ